MAPLQEIPHRAYLTAVLDELAVRAPEFAGRRLRSIYLGGGTPSLWPAGCLAEAIAAVCAAFAVEDRSSLEITVEANPVDCTAQRMAGWRDAGIDRVSIGVQSLAGSELVALGRDHRMGDGPAAIDAALAAGFRRLSADLILGAPGSGTAGEPGAALAGAAALAGRAVPHLSVYELTVAEGTPLERQIARGEVVAQDEDRLAELYLGAHELLAGAGYEHYEVSSYARPGARAVHNSLYWRAAEFLGLGSGAASFRREPDGGGVRWSNHRSVGRYLAAPAGERQASADRLSGEELLADRVWLGLRTSDGVPAHTLSGRHRLVDWLGSSGLAEVTADRIRPTLRGFLYSDQVARRVLDEFRYPHTSTDNR